jgi:hypothetical protein
MQNLSGGDIKIQKCFNSFVLNLQQIGNYCCFNDAIEGAGIILNWVDKVGYLPFIAIFCDSAIVAHTSLLSILII